MVWLRWDVWPLDTPEQHKNEENNQDSAYNTDTPMAEAVSVASEAATEATEQQDHEKNNEDGGKRHAYAPLKKWNATLMELAERGTDLD
jgi:hypothetical protein